MSITTESDDAMAHALAELATARERTDQMRRLVAERKVGASALHTAESVLNAALRRVDKLKASA